MSLFGIFGDVISDDLASLQSALNQYAGSGITNFGGAVAALQAAAQHAASSTGPAIDRMSGSSPQVMSMTQQAWMQNGVAAGANAGDSAAQSDVDTAAGAVRQMATLYGQAYRLAVSLHATPASSGAAAPSGYRPPAGGGAHAPMQVPVYTAPAAAKANYKPLLIGGGIFAGIVLLVILLPHLSVAKGVAALAA